MINNDFELKSIAKHSIFLPNIEDELDMIKSLNEMLNLDDLQSQKKW